MIKRILPLFLLLATFAAAQTTTISANALRDQNGTLVSGSLCFGSTLYAPNGVICQQITNGVLPSFTVPNGTYAVWLNEGNQTIYTLTGANLSGAAISADNFFLNQFAAVVAGNYVFFPSLNVSTSSGQRLLIPTAAGLACNGNSVTLPASPLNNQILHLQNISATTACSVSGNGNSVMYQAAVLASPSLAAKLSADLIYIQNYDFAGHNAWFVTHLGN